MLINVLQHLHPILPFPRETCRLHHPLAAHPHPQAITLGPECADLPPVRRRRLADLANMRRIVLACQFQQCLVVETNAGRLGHHTALQLLQWACRDRCSHHLREEHEHPVCGKPPIVERRATVHHKEECFEIRRGWLLSRGEKRGLARRRILASRSTAFGPSKLLLRSIWLT